MAGKKKSTKIPLLLFVVEGASDIMALRDPINHYLTDILHLEVETTFCQCRGDKTADDNIRPDELLKQLDKIVDDHLVGTPEYYTFADVSAIIYVCDTDGTYIPDKNCHEADENHPLPMGADGKKKLLYEKDGIYGTDADKIIKRNKVKSSRMDKLLSSHYRTKEKHTVKRQVYYFSANLDHFLHDDRNLYYGKKVNWAAEFAHDPDKALRRLLNHSTCVDVQALEYEGLLPLHADYDAKRLYALSWKYIKRGLNSIKRHTNLNLLLDALEKEGLEIFEVETKPGK